MDHVAAFDVTAGRGEDQQDRLLAFGRQGQQALADTAGGMEIDAACQQDGAGLEQRFLKEGVRLGLRLFFCLVIEAVQKVHEDSERREIWLSL